MPRRQNSRKDIPLKYVLLPFIILAIIFGSAILGLWVLFLSVVLTILYLLRNRISHMIAKSYANKYRQDNRPIENADGSEGIDSSVQDPEQQQSDESRNNPDNLLSLVKGAIDEFRPSIRYENEEGYHAELVGYLKSKFPSLKMEEQAGSSRPDVTIQDVAIEVKGPTGNKALDSLTTKCLKYLQHYQHLIVVLFEPFFSEGHFQEIKKGLEIKFPNVIMIRKPKYFRYEPSLTQDKNRGWKH